MALGANMPLHGVDVRVTLDRALVRIGSDPDRIIAISRFYETPCFPAGAGPDYVNAVALVGTNRSPQALLRHLHEIETEFGRERVERWGRRTLDLDLLAMGARILPDSATFDDWVNRPPQSQRLRAPDQLILPHPRLHERAFVLVPANDVAPDWRHPVLNQSIAEMTAALPEAEKSTIIPL